MQMREKVRKSRNTLFFQWFVAPEGQKVGSLKRRVRSHLAWWEMKNCTPLWREAHLQVKMCKIHQVRTTFGSWDVEKAHAVVARSTFRSQNVQNAPAPDHFWNRKSARRCCAKHMLKSKCTKHTSSGPLLEVEMSKKCTPLWREAHFEVKSAKQWQVRSTFGRSDVLSRGRRKGLCTLSTVSKTWGFSSISKSDGRRGTCEEDLQRCISRGRRSTKDMFIRDVRRSARWFPERGCIGASNLQVCWDDLAWQVQHFVWLGITFSWQAQYFRQVDWKNRITHWYEAVSSALNFPFLKEVSQNCFVFDVVKLKNWRSLAEVLRLWCCQLWKMRRSRRIASLLKRSTSKNEDVSQNCFVFDVVNFKKWGGLSELLRFWCCQLWKNEEVS